MTRPMQQPTVALDVPALAPAIEAPATENGAVVADAVAADTATTSPLADQEVPGAADEAIDVIEARDTEVLGVVLKARASGRQYRVRPVRDPRQPRFWCVQVFRCSSGGAADPTERPWTGGPTMTREELPAALAAIRADVGAWLAREECQELRRWLLTAADPAAATPPSPARTGVTRRSSGVRAPLPDPALVDVQDAR